MKRIFVAAFIFLVLALRASPAADVAVLVDVSGTMAQYGNWQPDVLGLIGNILDGRTVSSSDFKLIGNAGSLSQFRLEQGSSVHLLRFGSIKSARFPFFAAPISVDNPVELGRAFPETKRDFTEPRTNKDLAIAVGSQLTGGDTARLIVVSDFLVDADTNSAQADFVSRFQSTAKQEIPVIFTWSRDSRVLVKLIAVSGTTPGSIGPTANPAPNPASLTINVEAHVLPHSDDFFLRWHLSGEGTVDSYLLRLRDVKTRGVVKEVAGLSSSATSGRLRALHAGTYAASVVALLADGTQVESRPVMIATQSNHAGALLAVLVVAALGGLWWYLRWIKPSKRPALAEEMEEDR